VLASWASNATKPVWIPPTPLNQPTRCQQTNVSSAHDLPKTSGNIRSSPTLCCSLVFWAARR